MICANFATFTVAGGTLAATGSVHQPPCLPMESTVMSVGEYVAVVPDPTALGNWSSLGVTSSEILYVYSWGFAAVLAAWLLGYAVSLCIGIIRKL